MEALLIYIAKSTASMLVFYLAYRFLMKNDTFFKLSRYYLLIAFVVSMLLPLVNFSGLIESAEPDTFVYYTLDAVSVSAVAVQATVQENISLMTYIAYAYLGILSILLLGFFVRIGKIIYLTAKYNSKSIEGNRIYELSSAHSPFSFFNLIFINGDNLEIDEFEKIIQHERVHAKQLHTLDLLLLELSGVIFWINPMISIYKKSLQEIHEFIADDEVCRQGVDALDYKKLMVKQLTGINFESPANCFNSIKIRRRFGMITKSRTSKAALIKLAAIIPLSALVLFIYACADNIEHIDELTANDIAQKNSESFTEFYERTKDTSIVSAKPSISHEEMDKIIYGNMRLSEEAKKDNFCGKLLVYYNIDEKGNIINIKTGKGREVGGSWSEEGLKYGCNEEAIRLIKLLPKWQPATKDGKAIKQARMHSIIFGNRDEWYKEHRLSYYNKGINKEIKESDITPPFYVGGQEAMWKYIQENLKYPEEARSKGIQGTVELQLGIDKEGKVGTMKHEGGAPFVLVNAAMEATRNMPNWKPAIYKKTGKPIEAYVNVPFHFRLDDEKTPEDQIHIYKRDDEKADIPKEYLLEYDNGKKVKSEDLFPAQYPGGNKALIKFLQTNIKYPEEALKKGLQAEFKIGIMLNGKGEVTVTDNCDNVDAVFEDEAIRVIELMPKWMPAYVKKTGAKCPIYMKIPFKFKLNGGGDEKKFKSMENLPQVDMKDLQSKIEYPSEAIKKGLSGKVILEVVVDKTGKVTKCEVVESSDKIFDQAAIDAIMKVKITPGKMDNKPVKVSMRVPVRFKLR
jgi:bla regulator protein blaR1